MVYHISNFKTIHSTLCDDGMRFNSEEESIIDLIPSIGRPTMHTKTGDRRDIVTS